QRIDTSNDTVMGDISKQGEIITNIDTDEDVVLEDAKDVAVEKSADAEDNLLLLLVIPTATSTTITAADVPIPAAIIAAAPTLTAAPSRR
nr:hypothetical protein [Tanacetum cinerariifolium]